MNQAVKLSTGEIIANYQIVPCSNGTDYSKKMPTSFQSPDDYDQYLLACLPTIYTQNVFFYQFPAQLTLYTSLPKLNKKCAIFQLNTHGLPRVSQYSLRQSVRLVALDHKSNVDVLLATALQQGHPEMAQAFKNGDLSIILPFFCSLGYDGCVCQFFADTPYTVAFCQPSHWLTKPV